MKVIIKTFTQCVTANGKFNFNKLLAKLYLTERIAYGTKDVPIPLTLSTNNHTYTFRNTINHIQNYGFNHRSSEGSNNTHSHGDKVFFGTVLKTKSKYIGVGKMSCWIEFESIRFWILALTTNTHICTPQIPLCVRLNNASTDLIVPLSIATSSQFMFIWRVPFCLCSMSFSITLYTCLLYTFQTQFKLDRFGNLIKYCSDWF